MDIDRYLDRIGLAARPDRTPEGLAALQKAHRLAIGFENLDIPLGRPIRIDAASVFAKLVEKRRGGYCFEHNRLFADALSALGMRNRPLLARVRLGLPEGTTPPRTHVCLLVDLDGRSFLADAGFGGSDSATLALEDGATARTGDGAWHRLVRAGPPGTLGGEWCLQRAGAAGATDGRAEPHADWQAQYTFDLADVCPDDLEQANHWTSTRAATRFTTLHVAAIPQEQGFASLTDRELAIHGPTGTDRRVLENPEDFAETLSAVFRIELGVDDVRRLPLFA